MAGERILPEQNTSEAGSFLRGDVAPSGFSICVPRSSLVSLLLSVSPLSGILSSIPPANIVTRENENDSRSSAVAGWSATPCLCRSPGRAQPRSEQREVIWSACSARCIEAALSAPLPDRLKSTPKGGDAQSRSLPWLDVWGQEALPGRTEQRSREPRVYVVNLHTRWSAGPAGGRTEGGWCAKARRIS